MNLELYIENLGAIEKAELTVNPLTILAGENGTGKSFVTKFLYSVLKVLNQDVYKNELINHFNQFLYNSSMIEEILAVPNNSAFLHAVAFISEKRRNFINTENLIYSDILKNAKTGLPSLLDLYSQEVDDCIKKIEADEQEELSNLAEIQLTFKLKKLHTLQSLEKNKLILESIYKLMDSPEFMYFQLLEKYITIELKSNFQISSLKQLIRQNTQRLIFNIQGIITIDITDKSFSITQDFSSLKNLISINRITFFESPVYWKLSPYLVNDSSHSDSYFLSDEINDERLTGIPQHFLDLRELVFANFKHGERPQFIEECADELQQSLNGKFSSNGNDLAFETNQGKAISKNLVSFGMTNLGVLQAVLSKNIINKGSFVFIDEPESNLHPEWQAVLAKILVKLAENGVFVVITTHSSDMLKALDVISQEHHQTENFISVNYFKKNGHLATLNAENVSLIQQTRLKLLKTYDELVLRGYLV